MAQQVKDLALSLMWLRLCHRKGSIPGLGNFCMLQARKGGREGGKMEEREKEGSEKKKERQCACKREKEEGRKEEKRKEESQPCTFLSGVL